MFGWHRDCAVDEVTGRPPAAGLAEEVMACLAETNLS
jgi:hypothetical protein